MEGSFSVLSKPFLKVNIHVGVVGVVVVVGGGGGGGGGACNYLVSLKIICM